MVIKNQRHKYILGQVLHRLYQFSSGYSTTGKHYITINGQVIAQLALQTLDYLIVKTKGKVTLPPMAVCIIEVKTPKICNTTNLYEVNADTFHFPEGIILLYILHRVNHKTLQHLSTTALNTNNVQISMGKNLPVASMHPMGKCKEAQEVSWDRLQCDTSKLLPKIPPHTSLPLEPDTKSLASSIPDADILREARTKLQVLLKKKYLQIMSQSVMDISRTNWIKLDIPMEGPPITSKHMQYC